jgi:hypothetical protein
MLVANRVHSADGADLGDADALKETARHVAATSGTGLAWVVKGDESLLGPRLATTNLHHLFRVGHSLGLKLRTEVKARIAAKNSGMLGRGLLRLDAPLREVVAGFVRVRPLLYGGLLHPARVDYRPITSLNELAAAAAALTEAAFRAALLEGLGATDGLFADVDDSALPAHSAILGAWLARAAVGQTPTLSPLVDADVAALRDALVGPGATAAREQALVALDERVRALAPLPGAADDLAVITRSRTYARQILAAMSDELAAIKERHPDGRYLSSVWTR